MLGHSHATSGACAWAATAPTLLPYVGLYPGPRDIVVGTLVCAGAALVPDLDHHDSTIADFLGPPSELAARIVSFIFRGHRNGTHSLLFVLLAGAVTLAGVSHLGRGFLLGTVLMLLALALRALHLHPPGRGLRVWGTIMAQAAVATWGVAQYLPGAPDWLPYAVALGCAVHIAGDCLTPRGCPLLWPVSRHRFEIPVIPRTGGPVETWLIAPAMAVGTVAALYVAIGG
ncbi:MAG: metal-dependent hydrolase [Streptomycetales bacterium]